MDWVSFKLLAHALAGSIGGIVSLAIFFPLDSLRTRLQVGDPAAMRASVESRNTLQVLVRIARIEGLATLYLGLGAVLWTQAISNFLYFYAYNGLKQLFMMWLSTDALPAYCNCVVAATAGVINVLVTTPLWLVNTRMKVQLNQTSMVSVKPENCIDVDNRQLQKPYANLVDGLLRVSREEGIATLWDGTMPSLMLVSNPTIQWVAYEKAKQVLQSLHVGWGTYNLDSVSHTAVEFFVLGAVARGISTLITYPLQVAQTRLRYNHGVGPVAARILRTDSKDTREETEPKKRHSGTIEYFNRTYVTSGIRGLYKGLEAKLWQTILTAAFQLLVYEKLVSALLELQL